MSSGGSGGATTNTVAEFKPPDYTTPLWQDYTAGAAAASQQPYEQYLGTRVAPLNETQQQGLDLGYQRAVLGAPDLNAARGFTTDLSQGRYLGSNPYTGLAYQQQGSDPWLSNNYTQQAIGQNAAAMGQAYAQGTGAQTDAAMSRAGVYGGSAWQDAQLQGQKQLEGQVGTMANQLQMNQMGLGAADYQAAQQRALQAGLQQQNVGATDWANSIQQMLQGGQLAGQLSQDDWTAAKALTGVGDATRSYTQQLLDQGYSDWLAQSQYPYTNLDVLGNALTRASGGTAMGTSSSTATGPASSPLAGLLGLGAAGYAMYGS
jgi:hypothetical protein